jgi:hypothetical protein
MTTKIVAGFTGALAGAALLAWGSLSAQALPAAAVAADHGAGVTLVEGGCGVGWWRGPAGHCRPDRERVVIEPGVVVVEPGRVCPLGTHLGPHRRECIR